MRSFTMIICLIITIYGGYLVSVPHDDDGIALTIVGSLLFVLSVRTIKWDNTKRNGLHGGTTLSPTNLDTGHD